MKIFKIAIIPLNIIIIVTLLACVTFKVGDIIPIMIVSAVMALINTMLKIKSERYVEVKTYN